MPADPPGYRKNLDAVRDRLVCRLSDSKITNFLFLLPPQDVVPNLCQQAFLFHKRNKQATKKRPFLRSFGLLVLMNFLVIR
ncbi:hypothetical protein DS62_13590 [Smithella sp. SC_K08D17]|nr:hypothetical protein DS62_13590 [Smithella sp. SC_K08D17]